MRKEESERRSDLGASGVELLAPAGDFETALAAFEAGADAVYCGLSDFSARAFAKNFSFEELENLVAYAHQKIGGDGAAETLQAARNGGGCAPSRLGGALAADSVSRRRVYVTFNTLLDEDALDGAIETLARLDEIGPDALIVQDLGVARLCRRHFPRLTLHASTQLVAHNLEGVLALGEIGFKRVVLARELSLGEIASIAKRCGDIELECFIHGALCYSVSGLCLFGALEKGRSGNRGQCPYCCRQSYDDGAGHKTLPFSMKDLRLGEDVRKLVGAGVVSLKIEGRMKSPLYVASVTRFYRDILGGGEKNGRLSVADLETVFSRRTTELYLNGANGDVIDPTSLGHLGTPIGVVKKVTKDRDGLSWLRFHTARALEKHDGLQFDALTAEGRHLGMAILEMRPAISRHLAFEVAAGTDVEIRVNEEVEQVLRPGMKIYCSMSNAVKRRFPTPTFRPSDYTGNVPLAIAVEIRPNGLVARAVWRSDEEPVAVEVAATPTSAQHPEKTAEAVRKALAKLGGTRYALGTLTVNDPQKLFAPMSVLNDLRRDLVAQLDAAADAVRARKIERAKEDLARVGDEGVAETRGGARAKHLKIRVGQKVPAGDWDEIVVAINGATKVDDVMRLVAAEGAEDAASKVAVSALRLALPVYTDEPSFNDLRNAVKRFRRAGCVRWEAADLATLRMLRTLGVTDVTADWSLYAFNSQALALLTELGVRRFVASPENNRENLQYLAESGYPVEFLAQQSTPLFVSRTEPGEQQTLAVFRRDGLWVTTKKAPRSFVVPAQASSRFDLSWDPE